MSATAPPLPPRTGRACARPDRDGRGGGARSLLPIVLGVLLATSPAYAQEGVLDADAGFSHSEPPSGSNADAASYLLAGLRARRSLGDDAALFGSLYGGLGLASSSADWASLGAGGSWSRILAESLELQGQVRASAFTVGDPSPYRAVTAELLPGLRWWTGDAALFLDARAGLGSSSVEVRTEETRTVPGPGSAPDRVVTEVVTEDVASDLWYVGGGPRVRYPAGVVSLEAGLRAFDAASGSFVVASFGVRGTAPARVSWSVDLRVWDTPGGTEASGGLVVQVPFDGPWDGHASGGRTRPDPLLGTAPSVSGAVVMSRQLVRFGDGEAGWAGLYRVKEGGGTPVVRFRLARPAADSVAVSGDFTAWEPREMRREGGRWVLELPVEPGTYHFGFLVDGQWYVPEDAPGRVSDEWGRVNATLVVSEP